MSLGNIFEFEDNWPSDMGKAFLCERVVTRGEDLHADLGHMDWFSYYFFSITGKKLDENALRLLNFYWVATSYPDPSIWPNHVASLAGSVRSTPSLSIMSGLSISEASIYGRRPECRALDFFYRLGEHVEEENEIELFIEKELSERGTIFGYGRPLAKMDERVPFTLDLAEKCGLAGGKHLKLALQVYQYLNESKGLSMNIAAIDAALAADMGFSPRDYLLFMSPCFIAGIVPCFEEAAERPVGSFMPMRCTSIDYSGPDKRSW